VAAHRILLVEDDTPTRERLACALSGDPRLELVGSVGSLAEGREALAELSPDVLITDLGLPDGSGLELIRNATASRAEILAMVITVLGDERTVVSAVEAGALGYLLKDGSTDYLVRSTMELLDGGSPISPSIARYLLKHLRAGGSETLPPAADDTKPRLSAREQEVLGYLVKGFTYAETSGYLGVSEHTVATHVRRIYRKLAVGSRGEAVYEALQLGLVDGS